MFASVTHQLKDVASIDRGQSEEEKRSTLSGNKSATLRVYQSRCGGALWAIAEAAKRAPDRLSYRQYARETLQIDPDHTAANQALRTSSTRWHLDVVSLMLNEPKASFTIKRNGLLAKN